MLINEKNYTLPELNFNAMCRLEEMGINLADMDKKVLTTVRGFLALAMDGDFVTAGKELEIHLAKGGNLDQMVREISKAVENSGFFRGLSQSTQKKEEACGKTKAEEEPAHSMPPSER